MRSQGIDSQPGGPVRQPYLMYQPDYIDLRNRSLESILWLLKGLQIRAQDIDTTEAIFLSKSVSINYNFLQKKCWWSFLFGFGVFGTQLSQLMLVAFFFCLVRHLWKKYLIN